MKTGRYNVSDLLTSTEIDQIIIPEIQRDYVWTTQNVDGLLMSILKNYGEKKVTNLVIEDNSGPVDGNIAEFLSTEYARLRYNTRVGFIYAYHNREYADKYFLIDGQQRMTTIFLLLLAVYVKNDNVGNVFLNKFRDNFRDKYFKGSIPKLDYKVRETAHDFMIDFIEFELSKKSPTDSFRNSSEKFYEAYSNDITAKRLLENYEFIQKRLNSSKYDDSLIDYIENYIEFNYFDTNISEQGERLYIYMNSRGEGLSIQEKLKPLIVGRIEDEKKLEVGNSWERWQDFFWKHRGKNHNADKGFEEFCKWATVIHMIVNDKPTLKQAIEKNSKMQTTVEVIEDYLRYEGDGGKNETQKKWLRDYQEQNPSFDYNWLKSCFEAVEKLESFNSHGYYITKKWLQEITATIHYVPLLSSLYYLMRFPHAQEIDVKRVGMFFKNVCEYDTNAKNPDSTTVLSVKLVKDMADKNISDVANLSTLTTISDRLFTPTDKKKEIFYKNSNRGKWEEAFWGIVIDETFNRFLKGNIAFLLDWNYLFGNILPVDFNIRAQKLRKEIFERYTKKELLLDLLKYGDFCCDDRGGSDHLDGKWRHRYVLIQDGNTWYQALTTEALQKIICQYLEKRMPVRQIGNIYDLLTNGTEDVIDYMSSLRYLKADKYMVLLEKIQARADLARELMVQWLHKTSQPSWVYDYQTYVVDFKYDNSSGSFDKKGSSGSDYYLDLKYSNCSWKVVVGHRKNGMSNIPPFIKDAARWDLDNGKCVLKDRISDDWSRPIKDRLQIVINETNDLFTIKLL